MGCHRSRVGGIEGRGDVGGRRDGGESDEGGDDGGCVEV